MHKLNELNIRQLHQDNKDEDEVRISLRKAEKESWKPLGEQLNSKLNGNNRMLLNRIKSLRRRKDKQIRALKNDWGNLQTKTEDILKIFYWHYAQKFKLNDENVADVNGNLGQ